MVRCADAKLLFFSLNFSLIARLGISLQIHLSKRRQFHIAIHEAAQVGTLDDKILKSAFFANSTLPSLLTRILGTSMGPKPRSFGLSNALVNPILTSSSKSPLILDMTFTLVVEWNRQQVKVDRTIDGSCRCREVVWLTEVDASVFNSISTSSAPRCAVPLRHLTSSPSFT